MSIENRSTFSGYLVGIGKIRKDGSMDYHELERPVKNMIVKQGLNNFLRYNGSDTALATFTGSDNDKYRLAAYCFQCFQWCAYGDSNTASVFATTTELGHKLVDQYTTKVLNWPYCGSTIFETSKTRNRVTHKSDVAVTAANVKELGYYLKLNDDSYQMFSRVVLPAPFELDVGEQLITTYELVVEYGDISEPSAAFQTGLLDANGTPLEAKRKMSFDFKNNYSSNTIPHIYDSTGLPRCFASTSGGSNCLITPIFTSNTIFTKIRYWTNNHNFASGDFATENSSGSTMGPTGGNLAPSSITKPYVYDSFRREVELTLPQYWPNLNSPDESLDIYYIQNQGISIQFGHTVDGVWTPTPWKKTGNKITTITLCHTVATTESLEWQANQ